MHHERARAHPQKDFLQFAVGGYVGALDVARFEDGDVSFDGDQLDALSAGGFALSGAFSQRWIQAGLGLRLAAARVTAAEAVGFESLTVTSTATYAFAGPQLTAAESPALQRLTLFAHGLLGSEFIRVSGDGANGAASIDANSNSVLWGAAAGLRLFLTPQWAMHASYRFERSDASACNGAEIGLTF